MYHLKYQGFCFSFNLLNKIMGCDQFPIIAKTKKTVSVFICALYASLGIKYMQRRFVCRLLKGTFAKK